MCRLTAYTGPTLTIADLVTRPARSVIRQSFDARERLGGAGGEVYDIGALNADGFGLGWYTKSSLDEDGSPCVFKDVGPAWNNRNLVNLAKKTSSEVIFAHVRAAGPGMGVCSCTCHPFEFGRYLFMHNGQVSGFKKIRRRVLATLGPVAFNFAIENGCSDSAVAFAVFIDKLGNDAEDAWKVLAPAKLQALIQETIVLLCEMCDEENIMGVSLLNFVISDGYSLVATRFVHVHPDVSPEVAATARAASLYFSSGSSFEPEQCDVDCPNVQKEKSACTGCGNDPTDPIRSYRMVRKDLRDEVVIVTSEPLTESSADWVPIPTNHILLVSNAKTVLASPIVLPKNARESAIRIQQSERFNRVLDRFGLTSRTKFTRDTIGSPKTDGSRKLLLTADTDVTGAKSLISGYPEHTMTGKHGSAILTLVLYEKFVFSADGGTAGSICIWDLTVWKCVGAHHTHRGGVLSMVVDHSRNILYTSCADSVIYAWAIHLDLLTDEPVRLELLFEIFLPCVGHIISLTIDEESNALFVGSQDSCIRCIYLEKSYEVGAKLVVMVNGDVSSTEDGPERVKSFNTMPREKVHSLARRRSQDISCIPNCGTANHLGYIHAIVLHKSFVISAGGDGIINVWNRHDLSLAGTLVGHKGRVLGLRIDEDFLYSGSTDGTIRVWDLECHACCRVLLCPASVLAITIVRVPTGTMSNPGERRMLISSHADRTIHVRVLDTFQVSHSFVSAFGLVFCIGTPVSKTQEAKMSGVDFSSRFKSDKLRSLIACGTSSGSVVSWNLRPAPKTLLRSRLTSQRTLSSDVASQRTIASDIESLPIGERIFEIEQALDECLMEANLESFDEALVETLREMVRIQTVSSDPLLHEECWFGAKVMSRLLEKVGCEVQLAFDEEAKEAGSTSPILPVVIATLRANAENVTNPERVVVYGHYDVVAASSDTWDSDPWEMSGRDGYLYGRGVTDDKGPILACVFAAKALHFARELECDVTFIVEGQEESGLDLEKRGFGNVILANRSSFLNTATTLISNNYWIDDQHPCLTYGMRGVIDFHLEVKGSGKNVHAGVHGGGLYEPSSDLIALLGSLHDQNGKIAVPELMNHIRPLSEEEKARFEEISLDLDVYASQIGVQKLRHGTSTDILRARWCEPSLSISTITTSNATQCFRTIPKVALAKVSLHFVPDQDPNVIRAAIETYLHKVFAARDSANVFSLEVRQVSDWWLGDVHSDVFTVAEDAIKEVWGRKPLCVREGGSYGGISSFLEHSLNAPVIHLPMGQATDSAHLPNERISVENLIEGKLVVQEFLRRIPHRKGCTNSS